MGICVNMQEEATFILPSDGAVESGYEEYYESGFDESKLELSGEPVRWRSQRPTYDQRKLILDTTSPVERRELIIRCTLLSVSGYKVARKGGVICDAPAVTHEDSARWKRAIVKMDWLKRVLLSARTEIEYCQTAMLHAEGAVPFIDSSAPQSTPGDTGESQNPTEDAESSS